MSRIFYTIAIIILSFSCFSQTWPKIYGDNIDAGPRKVIETYDKGYLIISNIYISDYYRYIWLIKTDINGEIIWDKKIGEGSYRYYIDDINQTYDGGYILIFRCSKYDIDEDPVVMKLNACAEIEWCTTLHTDGYNRGVKVIQAPDSNYLALSMYHSPQPADRIFLFKLNQLGEVLWSNLYAQLEPGIFNEEGFDLTIFPNDSSYLITGTCDYVPTGGLTGFWIKVNSTGEETANIIWNDTLYEYNSIFETVHYSDHFCSIGTKGYGLFEHSPTIFKLNNNGDIIDYYRVENNDTSASADAIRIFNDTLFVIGARWDDDNPPYQDYCKVFLTDTTGNIIIGRTLANELQSPRNVEITYDNKILVLCGFVVGSNWDIYFYKLNQYLEDDTLYNIQLSYDSLCPGTILSDTMTINCDIWVNIDEMFDAEKNSSLLIYPNPARDFIRIEIPNYSLLESSKNGFQVTSAKPINGELTLVLYDGFGRQMDEMKIPNNNETINLNTMGFNAGLYIAVLYNHGKIIASEKIVIQ